VIRSICVLECLLHTIYSVKAEDGPVKLVQVQFIVEGDALKHNWTLVETILKAWSSHLVANLTVNDFSAHILSVLNFIRYFSESSLHAHRSQCRLQIKWISNFGILINMG